jgi:peptidoglycan/xylan/chitin deacetylase (PgdA/CDA1 family)
VSTLPVLTYHSLDDSGSPISIEPALFRRQMYCLARNGFQTFTLSDGLARLQRGRLPDRALALTFDDGFLNTLTVALPILVSCGLTATVFPVSGYLGRLNDFPTQPPGVPRLPMMEWSGVNELRAAGWEIGAHSQTHPDLTRIPARDVREELTACRLVIEQQLGIEVLAFAYPYGRFGVRERTIAGELFPTAVGTSLGLVRPHSHPLALARVDAYYLTHPDLMCWLDSPLLSPYLAFRQAVRLARGKS